MSMEKHSSKKGIKIIVQSPQWLKNAIVSCCRTIPCNEGLSLLKMFCSVLFHYRYNQDLELEDAIHTAILTLKVSFSVDNFS